MKQTFLQLWIFTTLFFVVGLLLYEGIQRVLVSDEEAVWLEDGLHGEVLLIAEEISKASDQEVERKRLEQVIGKAIAFVDRGAIDFEGSPDGFGIHRGQWFYAKPLGSSSHRMVMVGPLPEYPAPPWDRQVGIILFVSSALGALCWLVLRPLSRAERSLVAAVEALADGRLETRIDERAGSATSATARTFNRMAAQLQELIRAQGEILRAASHELRTPIARLRIGVHLIASSSSAEDRQAREERLDDDLQELDDLVEEILLYSRLDVDSERKEPELQDVAPIAARVAARVQQSSGNDQIKISLKLPPDLQTRIAAPLLERALRNLILNASRYANSSIIVKAETKGRHTLIHVDDDGPGIPKDNRESARLPFVTLDGQGGHGLGLAIVARICEVHSGHLNLAESETGGLRATLTLPGNCQGVGRVNE